MRVIYIYIYEHVIYIYIYIYLKKILSFTDMQKYFFKTKTSNVIIKNERFVK